MAILAGLFLVISLLAIFVIAMFSFHLRDSDPAGNGLATAFYVIGAVALWALLGLTLLLAGIRSADRAEIPGWTTVFSIGLFVFCAGAHLACVRVLTDRDTDGGLRRLLQIAGIILPLCVLHDALWRAFAMPASPQVAAWMTALPALVFGAAPWPRLLKLSRR